MRSGSWSRPANKYVDQTEPWKLGRTSDLETPRQVVYTVLEACAFSGSMLWPFMPSKSAELAQCSSACSR